MSDQRMTLRHCVWIVVLTFFGCIGLMLAANWYVHGMTPAPLSVEQEIGNFHEHEVYRIQQTARTASREDRLATLERQKEK